MYLLYVFMITDCDLHMLSASPVEQKELKEQKEEEEKPLIDPDKSVSHSQ